jgi:hypothetical protein
MVTGGYAAGAVLKAGTVLALQICWEETMLKRLLSGFNNIDDQPGDVTTDGWEPVPVTASALPEDTFDWLQGDPMPSEPVHPFLPLDDDEPDPPDYLQSFSPEELAIIEQQRAETEATAAEEPEPEPLFKMPVASRPPEPVKEPEPEPVVMERKTEPPPPQSRKRILSERGRWVEVVKNVGEHLSEIELKIIRKQLASS